MGDGLAQGTAVQGESGLAITDPPDGARFALSPDVPASDQEIEVTISGPPATGSKQTISGQQAADSRQLLVDGKVVGACSGQPCTVLWPLRTGHHLLQATAIGPGGHTRHGTGVWVTVEGQ